MTLIIVAIVVNVVVAFAAVVDVIMNIQSFKNDFEHCISDTLQYVQCYA